MTRTPGKTGALAAVLALTLAVPGFARDVSLDRLEDRLDRAENRADAQSDTGWRDVAEDRADRIEGRLDKHGIEVGPVFDRHERRTWRRILRSN